MDRRISDLLDEIIHFCEFQQARRTGSAYFTDGEKPVSETH